MRLPGAGPGVECRTYEEHGKLMFLVRFNQAVFAVADGRASSLPGDWQIVRYAAVYNSYRRMTFGLSIPDCPECKGSGIGDKERGETYQCPWCGGTGEYDEDSYDRAKLPEQEGSPCQTAM